MRLKLLPKLSIHIDIYKRLDRYTTIMALPLPIQLVQKLYLVKRISMSMVIISILLEKLIRIRETFQIMQNMSQLLMQV